LKYFKSIWRKAVDALEWRGVTAKDLCYVVFCIGSLSMAIALMLAMLLGGAL
tara:strand:- start:123 stop:278 length:156 start_codon:yes stop_codon:yes gene_type:complete